MKRIKKGLFLFIVLVLSLTLVYPLSSLALTDDKSYISINDTTNFEVENLSFSDISFQDYSSTSSQAFGLTGYLENNSNEEVYFTSIVKYYDSDHNLVAEVQSSKTAPTGTSDFNQMSNLSILNNRNVDEIYYYNLSVTISSEDNVILNTTLSNDSKFASYDYVIDKYDINVVVNENNTLDVTETITAYFNVSKHGIYRTIPLKNTITRLDGTTSKNKVQITNVNVDNEYTTYKEKNNLVIKIGSDSHTLKGEHTYTIKYTYNLGKDPGKRYDELYYNLIGSKWDTVIGNITFSITMPKEFDSSKLGFSSGKPKSTDNSKINYNVQDNVITGSYNGILGVHEALTVRCELSEGYFVNAHLDTNMMNYIYFLVPVMCLAISILLWCLFGRDDEVIETVEFYPPEGFNSLELGFLYKGKAENMDVISLLIYFANKGYIKITETEEKILFTKIKDFKITKLKEYDGNNINEKLFLDGLFEKNQTVIKFNFHKNNKETKDNSVEEVTKLDLKNNFYVTLKKILKNVNNRENKKVIFEESSLNQTILVKLMIIASYLAILVPPLFDYYDIKSSFHLIIIMCICAQLFWSYINMDCSASSKRAKTIRKINKFIRSIIVLVIIVIIPWVFIMLPALKIDSVYVIGYVLGLICIMGMIICSIYLPKRNTYGTEMLGKIRGFRNFLETAEKDKLEEMVNENPTYFYDILPYTYVLAVSDKWISKFETIATQSPSWYDGPTDFDIDNFASFMESTMFSAQDSTSSSSSDSSGGGSSDGGSGGGGGGSW